MPEFNIVVFAGDYAGPEVRHTLALWLEVANPDRY
jgi:hypothetical protein